MKTKNFLIIANITIYILLSFKPDWAAYLYNSFDATIAQKQYWRLLTYGFVHGNIWHLFLNMYLLNLVAKLDSRRLLLHYVFCLQMAGIFSITSNTDVISIGASGAIIGCLFHIIIATLLSKPEKRKEPEVLITVLVVLAFSLLPLPHRDIMAHVGGIVGGILLLIIKK